MSSVPNLSNSVHIHTTQCLTLSQIKTQCPVSQFQNRQCPVSHITLPEPHYSTCDVDKFYCHRIIPYPYLRHLSILISVSVPAGIMPSVAVHSFIQEGHNILVFCIYGCEFLIFQFHVLFMLFLRL